MNESNALHCDKPTDKPRDCNSQPTTAHFKSRISTPKIIPMVSYIMRRLNNHAIDNGDVEVNPSEFPVESNSESVTYPDTTPIKSIDDD